MHKTVCHRFIIVKYYLNEGGVDKLDDMNKQQTIIPFFVSLKSFVNFI